VAVKNPHVYSRTSDIENPALRVGFRTGKNWYLLTAIIKDKVTGEINTTITKEGAVITTNTLYDNGRPISQNISIRDGQGRVHTENVFGKLLP